MKEWTHRVPASDVDAEEALIREALRGGGYDAADLYLSGLAQQAVARRAIGTVSALNIPIAEAPWKPTANGCVEIVFKFEREQDCLLAKVAL